MMRPDRTCVTALLTALSLGLIGCTDSRLQPDQADEVEVFDNLLRIEGEVCTQSAREVAFPVKVLFLFDQSASLNLTDPSGERYAALQDAMGELLAQPDVYVGGIGFSGRVETYDFARVDLSGPLAAAPLSPGTDYQGVVASATALIERDVTYGTADPSQVGRTRYVVVLITDGAPYPQCLAGCEDDVVRCANGTDDDRDGLLDGADPDCADIDDNVLHPDNLEVEICNGSAAAELGEDWLVDLSGLCPAYNTPERVLQRVDELMSLKDTYSIGDIRLHSYFVFTADSLPAVGLDRDVARSLLRRLADRGRGVFREVDLESANVDFLDFDYAALQSRFWLTELVALNENVVPGPDGPRIDSDADGLADDDENDLGTDRRSPDSDLDVDGNPAGDNYGDLFEVRFERRGFDALNPAVPASPCASAVDSDNDRLNDCEERFAGTSFATPDSDGDRIPDGLEVRYGTDPLVADAGADPDFDGLTNREEIRSATDPRIPDLDRWRREAIRYGLDDLGDRMVQGDLRRCYEFEVSRIPLVDVPVATRRGRNRIYLYSMEEETAGATPTTQAACIEAIYQGEQLKDPPSGVVEMTQAHFDGVRGVLREKLDRIAYRCHPDTPDISLEDAVAALNRGALAGYVDECIATGPSSDRSVQVGRFLYPLSEMEDLLAAYFSGGLNITGVPAGPEALFGPLELLDDDACYKPWELGRLQLLLDTLGDACAECRIAQAGRP